MNEVESTVTTRAASPPTVATVEEEAAVFSPRQQPKPKQAALRVSSSCGQTAVVGGGVVWWWRENSPKNPVDLFSESEQAARSVYAAASCQRSHCSTKTHSSPPPPSPNSGFEIGPQVLSTLGETLITQLCMWTSDGSSWNQKFCNNKKFREKSLTNDKRKLCFFEDFPIC